MGTFTRYFQGLALVFIGIAIGWGLFFFLPGEENASSQKETPARTSDTQKATLYTCPMHPQVISKEPGQCPICGMDLVPVKQGTSGSEEGTEKTTSAEKKGKILYWQAPMDPTEIYDHPGKSKMGMDLVPVYESDVQKGGTVKIDPITVQNMGVRTVAVREKTISKSIRTVGTVAYDEQKMVAVTTKISGWIERLFVDYTGKRVRKGAPMLEIYSPDLVATQQEYLLALKNRKLLGKSSFSEVARGARDLLKATRDRLKLWDISPVQIRALENRGALTKTLTLFAPTNGFVIEKKAFQGDFVRAGAPLFKIADLSTVWLNAIIYENDIPWVHLGQKAIVRFDSFPNRDFSGTVSYIYPYLERKTRSVAVRLTLDNRDLILKPNMFATVFLKTRPQQKALVVPSEAVIRTGVRVLVFIALGKGKFQPRQVQLGIQNADEVQVASGLLPGEKVVTSAQFLLDSESRLQEAIQKMLAEKKK